MTETEREHLERVADKKTWGPGPWQDEPDRLEFSFEGFACLILRADFQGNLCGYVAVPPGHPWYGVARGDLDASCHGGVTWAAHGDGIIGASGDGLYWVGFDCAHCFDYPPKFAQYLRNVSRDMGTRSPMYGDEYDHDTADDGTAFGYRYRTLDYVRAFVELLAVQARAAAACP